MVTRAENFGGVSDAGLLLVKLAAFAVMILDHVDWFLYGGALGINATIGRAVFPAFAAVLGINLARMNVPGMYRLTSRLLLAGAVASVPYTLLQGELLPLNVLWSLAAAVVMVTFLRHGSRLGALLVWIPAGLFLDYQWCGLAAVVGAWWLASRGFRGAFLLAALLVVPFNGSWWSLAVLPLALAAGTLPAGPAPRWKWLFYVGYPAHLVVLALLEHVL
ncbi:TraX family protein [Luteimonas sp. SDU82]|uniref:TraX family protein n=1 Tax=Luteimonas sp. SDU82 TaxID=3422592 RepID=UPI003EBABBB5